MVVENIYGRKNTYGGIHIIAKNDDFYSVGTKFDVVLKSGTQCTFEVKKVYMDDDDALGSRNERTRLTYQLVDNGRSFLSSGVDFRVALGCDIVLTPPPKPILEPTLDEDACNENDDSNSNDVNDNNDVNNESTNLDEETLF